MVAFHGREGRARLFDQADLPVEVGERVACLRFARRERRRGRVALLRARHVALSPQQVAEEQVRLCQARIERHRAAHARDGALDVPAQLEDARQVEMRQAVSGIGEGCLVECPGGIVEPLQGELREPQVVPGARRRRRGIHGALEAGDGLLGTAAVEQQVAQRVPGRRPRGLERDRSPVAGLGALEVAQVLGHMSGDQLGRGIGLLERERAGDARARLVEAARLVLDDRTHAPVLRDVRRGTGQLAVCLQGGVHAPRAMVLPGLPEQGLAHRSPRPPSQRRHSSR